MVDEKSKIDRYMTVADLIGQLSKYESNLLVQIRVRDEAGGDDEGTGFLEHDTLDITAKSGAQVEQGLDHGAVRLTIPLDMN